MSDRLKGELTVIGMVLLLFSFIGLVLLPGILEGRQPLDPDIQTYFAGFEGHAPNLLNNDIKVIRNLGLLGEHELIRVANTRQTKIEGSFFLGCGSIEGKSYDAVTFCWFCNGYKVFTTVPLSKIAIQVVAGGFRATFRFNYEQRYDSMFLDQVASPNDVLEDNLLETVIVRVPPNQSDSLIDYLLPANYNIGGE
jgi:hypothetical protein